MCVFITTAAEIAEYASSGKPSPNWVEARPAEGWGGAEEIRAGGYY